MHGLECHTDPSETLSILAPMYLFRPSWLVVLPRSGLGKDRTTLFLPTRIPPGMCAGYPGANSLSFIGNLEGEIDAKKVMCTLRTLVDFLAPSLHSSFLILSRKPRGEGARRSVATDCSFPALIPNWRSRPSIVRGVGAARGSHRSPEHLPPSGLGYEIGGGKSWGRAAPRPPSENEVHSSRTSCSHTNSAASLFCHSSEPPFPLGNGNCDCHMARLPYPRQRLQRARSALTFHSDVNSFYAVAPATSQTS